MIPNRGLLMWAMPVLLLVGCLDASPKGPGGATGTVRNCDPTFTDHYGGYRSFQGNGSWTAAMAPAVLRQGRDSQFRVSFPNPDCRTYGFQNTTLFEVGGQRFQLALEGRSMQIQADPVYEGPPPRNEFVAPGEVFSIDFDWDGSVALWNHSAVEAGRGWETTRAWLAPGTWPWTAGAYFASYRALAHGNLIVERDGVQGPELTLDGCRGVGTPYYGWPEPRNMTVALTASPSQAPLGTPIILSARYTLHFPAPGCYLMGGKPAPFVTRSDRTGRYGIDACTMGGRFDILVLARQAEVSAELRWTYDGVSPASAPDPSGMCQGRRPAGAPGREHIALELGTFTRREVASTDVTWTVPG